MSKKPHKRAEQTTLKKPKSSKESHFSRNRGKIALALGIVIGVNSSSILRGVWRTSYQIRDAISRQFRDDNPSKKKADPKPDPIKESIVAMPSPCDLREGTFLANSVVLDRKCENETTDALESSCSMSYTLQQLRYTAEEARDQASDSIRLFDSGMCQPVNDGEKNNDPTCGIMENDNLKFERDKYRTLENLSDPYKSALEAFDPEAYKSLKRTVLVRDGNDQLLGIEEGNLGTAEGPLSLVCGQLIPSADGQFHVIEMADKLDEIDLEQSLWANDRESLRRYMLNTTVLAHEVFGHAGNTSEPLGMCKAMDPVQAVKDELYAHHVSAKMLAFMIQRHPLLHDIVDEDEAEYERFKAKMKQLSICELGLEEKEVNSKKVNLILKVELLKSYLLAEKSGDWREFKYLVLDRTRIGTWESVAYMLAYYKQKGRTEDFQKLNEAFKTLMNSESPEKLFAKK